MKRLALFQSPGEILWGSNEQIHCEGPRNFEANSHRLIVLIPARHHDEDIDIAVGVRRAVGVGAEQNDFVRLVSLGDFAGELANRAHGHVGATVIALGFVGEFRSRGHAISLPSVWSWHYRGSEKGTPSDMTICLIELRPLVFPNHFDESVGTTPARA